MVVAREKTNDVEWRGSHLLCPRLEASVVHLLRERRELFLSSVLPRSHLRLRPHRGLRIKTHNVCSEVTNTLSSNHQPPMAYTVEPPLWGRPWNVDSSLLETVPQVIINRKVHKNYLWNEDTSLIRTLLPVSRMSSIERSPCIYYEDTSLIRLSQGCPQ